jgi:hypothetical protein
MSRRRLVALASLLLCLSACGDRKEPLPAAPSSPPRQLTFAIAGAPAAPGVGESFQLRAVVVYTDGSSTPPRGDVTWRSSNEAVIAVWPGGVLVARGPGDATISATADGQQAEAALRVEPRGTNTRRLQGRLTDFASDAPLPGVTIGFGVDFGGITLQATTDPGGAFTADLPAGNVYAEIDGQRVADLVIRVGGPAYRGDLLGNGGTCISRYGVVSDAATFQPVAGATIRIGFGGREFVTGPDGWYRMDFGCPDDSSGNFSTTFMYVTHPAFRDVTRGLGRGVHRVRRIDVELERP